MNYVRDRAEARWLPSRHRFALARLAALVMLHFARPKAPPVDHFVLAVDRDQSAIENYATSIWFVATTGCYIGALLPLAPLAAIVAGLGLVLTAIQIIIPMCGAIFHSKTANSIVMMLSAFLASVYFAASQSWVRFVALSFLIIVALNALAAAVLWLLRDRVRRVEERCAA